MLRPWNLTIDIDRSSSKAIYIQIADNIAADIQSGRLAKGTALPSSRSLAAQLKLNRNTVIDAIQLLLSEGWLVSQTRRGIFVAAQLPYGSNLLIAQKIDLSVQLAPTRIIFDDGNPDSKIVPIEQHGRAYRQIFKRSARWKMMGYADPRGHLDFREEIANMLNIERNMHIDKNNLCISRGSQMAMYLVAQCLLRHDDYIFVESPGYHSAWKIFEKAGARLIPIPVDTDGLIVDELLPHLLKKSNIRALYLTPHRQYPTTVTLSKERRSQLIALSNQHNFTIIEDDYDYEFHFEQAPYYPLASQQELINTVYIGTLSKVVAPALRIGYLATRNEQLLQQVTELRYIIDIQGDNIMEQAVLELIQDGTIRRHIRKATLLYKKKRDFMIAQVDKYLQDHVSYTSPQGGLAVWLSFKHQIDWAFLSQKLRERSVHIPHPENYSRENIFGGIRLGYGSLSEELIEEGIIILAELLEQAKRSFR
ncbi:MAG TPA: PLP-dependent aminotransferase family protein [Sphingobacterium sp.]|nr:PLP-dependent aminotransferase family protein [Sphingobacterium sp.]